MPVTAASTLRNPSVAPSVRQLRTRHCSVPLSTPCHCHINPSQSHFTPTCSRPSVHSLSLPHSSLAVPLYSHLLLSLCPLPGIASLIPRSPTLLPPTPVPLSTPHHCHINPSQSHFTPTFPLGFLFVGTMSELAHPKFRLYISKNYLFKNRST